MGYKNLIPKDPKVHSESAMGRKQPQRIICAPQPSILDKHDIIDAHYAAQKSADEVFEGMLNQGPQYTVVDKQSGKRYPLLGACGFASIKFSGVKEKNMLQKLGVTVNKAYGGGFSITNIPLSAPQWAVDREPSAGAYYFQSVDLKAAAMRAFLRVIQGQGYLKDAYVDTRLD